MKKLLFFLILFLTPSVFAQDFNVSTSDISSPNSSGTGKYTGLEIYNSGTSNVYNIGTRYNGQLSRIIFNLASGGYADANGFEKGHTYTLTMNMASDDWRNRFGSVSVKCEGSSGQELSNGRVSYISYRKIKFSFIAPSSTWCQFVYVDLKSTNITSTAFTGVSNWNLSSLVITDPAYCSNCGSSGSSTPTPTPSSNQDIINNQNSNTQNIINNQNSNTTDIIDNNNSNTQDVINATSTLINDTINIIRGNVNQNCNNSFNFQLSKGKYYDNSGNAIDDISRDYYYSDLINLNGAITLSFDNLTINGINGKIYFYNSSGNLVDYFNLYKSSRNVPSGSTSFKFYVIGSPNVMVFSGSNGCVNRNDSNTQDIINNQNSNTNTIINNQNSNTNTITNNNNQNTDRVLSQERQNIIKQINQERKNEGNFCSNYIDFDFKGGYRIDFNGGLIVDDNYLYTDYIPFNRSTNSVLSIKGIGTSVISNDFILFYDSNKNLIDYFNLYSRIITTPTNISYFRITTKEQSSLGIFYGDECLNRLDIINDTMKDSSIDDKTGFFTNFNNDNHGLTGIITLPLATIQSLANSSCVSLSIPVPFTNDSFDLPCMTQIYQSSIPDIYSMWQVVSFGIISYYICLDIFKMVKGFKDPNDDKIEVLDL